MAESAEPAEPDRSVPDPPRGEPLVDLTLTAAPLDLASAYAAVAHPQCGGVGVFAGVVRDHHQGDAIDHLDYEAWQDQALPALRAVADDVLSRFPGVRAVHLAHRTGRLDVGEVSVVCAASAPHRGEAIAATQALIDQLKQTVPIWKHEHLADGGSRWP